LQDQDVSGRDVNWQDLFSIKTGAAHYPFCRIHDDAVASNTFIGSSVLCFISIDDKSKAVDAFQHFAHFPPSQIGFFLFFLGKKSASWRRRAARTRLHVPPLSRNRIQRWWMTKDMHMQCRCVCVCVCVYGCKDTHTDWLHVDVQ